MNASEDRSGSKIGLCADVRCMTAFAPRTDIRRNASNGRFVPEPVMSQLHDGRIAGLSALENLRITVTLGAASGCRLASTRCPIAEPAVGKASSTPILLAAYPL
jgi:hypothetical protein